MRDKVLAAQRAGVSKVILPHENEPDLAELPPEARDQLEFVLADTVADVLSAAFDGKPARKPKPRSSATRERRAARSA